MTNNAPAPGEIVGHMNDGTTIRQARPDPEKSDGSSLTLETIGAEALSQKVFPKLRQPVEGLVPEGCTLLAGAPKIGKSWFSLNMCCAVATGSSFLGRRTELGKVLYLDLEESQRLVNNRLNVIKKDLTDNFRICTTAPNVDNGLFKCLSEWMDSNPDTNMIIIDTFQTVRQAPNPRLSLFDNDYKSVEPFTKFGTDNHVAIIIVHHLNKRDEGEDPTQRISGTNGMLAAATQGLILSRNRREKDANLFQTSRELVGGDITVRFNNGIWTAIGPDVLRRERYDSDPLVKACRALLSTCMGRSVERTFGDFKEYAAQMAGTAVAGTERELSNKLHDLEPDLMEFDGIQIEFRPRVTGSNGKRSGGFRLH